MIPTDRYIRMVLHMESDVSWLREKVLDLNVPLRHLFGDEAFKKTMQKIDLIWGNVQEMKQDLRIQGLI